MANLPRLSPEELASVLATDDKSATREEWTEFDRFSLRRPAAIASADEPQAKRRAERIATALAACLGDELDTDAAVALRGFRQQHASTVFESSPEPAWVLSFGRAGGGGIALVLDPVSALTVVEIALGGTGATSSNGREPTPLEIRVMRNLGNTLVAPLRTSSGVSFESAYFTVDRLPWEVAAGGEIVGAALLELRLGESDCRGVLLLTPSLLQPDSRFKGSTARGTMSDRLGRVPVTARPVLSAGKFRLGELMQLGPGSVLELPGRRNRWLELRIAGETVFTGRVIRKKSGAEFAVHWRRGARS